MALPGARALYLPDGVAGGPPEAFIDHHEFCHLHPLPEGTIHLVLPLPVVDRAAASGWVQRHPLTIAGILTTLVMVYAPRTSSELETALGLIGISRRFAKGAKE
jgi:phospholipase/carboxylesterase